MWAALNTVKRNDSKVNASILELDQGDTDAFLDDQGRTIRWQRVFDEQEAQHKQMSCGRKGERILSDVEAVEALNQL